MSFTQSKLSLFHSFSKMPAQDSTSLGNAINKSGHTVTASEVWASDIPYYGKMGSLQDAIDKVQPYARKNDLCFITAGTDKNKTYIYDGAGNWTLINGTGKLTQGQLLKNAKDENVILYHENETLTNLNESNNANTDSANNAARLWTTIGKDGQVCASRLVEQFVGPTDKALNGLASVAFSPSIAEGALVAGTDYWDYCFSGTILWEKTRSAATKITCFEYIGAKVSDVVDTVSTQGTTLQTVKDQVDTISDALGLGSEVVGTTLGSRVTDNENALKVLLGLAEGDKVVASESIATTAAKAVSTSLTGTADGTIGKAIADAKQEALDAINAIQHFSVVVVPEGQTMENVTPVENTIYLVSDSQAADGSYIEYIAFKQGETVVTERIGTTKLDLEGYTTDAEHTALAERVTALDEATTGRVAVVEGKVKTLEETTVPALEQAISDAKDEAIANATVKLTQGTGITITNSGTAQHEFTISVSDTVATSADLQALTNRVSANEGDIKTITEETIVGLDTRLSDAEATITTLTGSGDDSIAKKIESAINSAKEEIKGTTDAIAATANTAVQSASGDTYVSAEKEAGTTNIKVTTNISAIDAELVKTSSSVGAAIKAASDAASDVDAALTAAKNEIKATTDGLAQAITKAQGDAVTAANSYTDGQISAAKTEIKGTTDAIAATANTAAQSAEGDTYVSASQSGTKITVSTNIANITSHVDSELVKSGTAVATAIQAASNAGTGAAAEALAAAQAAQQTAEARISKVSEGTESSLLSVSTSGTEVTITLDGDVATKTNISETALTGEGESSDKHVKVTLGGTLGEQTVTVETDDIASAQALQALSDRVTGLHQTPQFSVVVVAGVTDLANWKDAVDGGIKKNTIYLVENTEAADGSYIEFIAYESGDTIVTERIGTTKTDLADYAKTTEVEQAISDAIGALDATNVGTGAVKVSQEAGIVTSVTVATESLVSDDAIKTSVTDANALVTAADALEAIKLAKPENYVASVTGYTTEGEEVTTTQGAAVKVLDGRGTSVTANDIWGTTATMDANGVVTVDHKNVTNPNASKQEAWNTSITKVEDNKAYVGDTLYGNIQTDMIKDGIDMFNGCYNLTSFSSDLSSLKDGKNMFTHCENLITFDSDLSSLTNGSYMFAHCYNLTSFDSDLSSLTNGENMFQHCNGLTSFDSDLSSLKDGPYMFNDTKLTTFTSDLSNLTNGQNMFTGCNQLETFSSDLSSLEIGHGMFANTQLASFEGDLSSLTTGRSMFQDSPLTSFTGDLSSLTNGLMMFYNTQLASFTGDLSSLTGAVKMFRGCSLDTESVECIADTINTVEDGRIEIDIANDEPNEAEKAAFKQILDKGWDVYVNGSDTVYVPAEGEATLDETGETTVAPKAYWAKPIEVTEEEAEFVGADGKFYQVVGGQFIYVNDPDTYGMFVSREDAIANMRLTKYVKPVEEA